MKTQPTAHYIPPSLKTYKSLEDLLRPPSGQYTITGQLAAEDIEQPTVQSLSQGRVSAFVIADPGYGKSELLRQVKKNGDTKGRAAAFIDLKDTAPGEIAGFYNEGTVIYCFDALDEVRYDHYQGIIQALYHFAEAHPEASILISCRRHDAANNREKFYQFSGFEFIGIAPFEYPMIKSYIEQEGIDDEELMQTLFHRARPIRDKLSLLSIPRYLKAVITLVQKQEVSKEQIKTWKRKDFFERFIYTRLEEAAKVAAGKEGALKQNEKEITKRVLEKLALVMEIYQVNRISKDEFVSFLDGVQSNVNLVFLNICDIDTFFKRVLETWVEQGVEYLEFNNTEFQEYLAAKELARVAGNPQAIYDLVMQPQFGNIYSNWYDVLRYLVEIKPEMILPIMEFLNQKLGQWVDSGYWDLLSGVNPQELAESDRAKVFEYAFGYLQNHKSAFIANPRVDIAQFYAAANYPLLREPIPMTDEDSVRRLYNQIDLIKFLAVKGLLNEPEKEKWQQRLIGFAMQEEHETIQANSIVALHHFDDLELLKKIVPVFKSTNIKVRQAFIQACYRVDPNADFSVGIFLEALSNRRNPLATDGINSITDPGQLLEVLKAFEHDERLLAAYIEESMSFVSHIRWKLIDHLSSNWEASFEEPLVAILKKLLTVEFSLLSEKEELADKVIELLGLQNEQFICQLVDFSPVHLIYKHHQTLRKLLRPTHTTSFIERFLQKNPGSRTVLASHIFHPLYELKENHSDAHAIYEAGRVYLNEQYQQWELPPKEQPIVQWTEEKERAIFNEFIEMLNQDTSDLPDTYRFAGHGVDDLDQDTWETWISLIENAQFVPHDSQENLILQSVEVFDYFLAHEQTIRKYAATEDLKKLGTMLTNSIARIKPETMVVELKHQNAVSMSYRLDTDLQNVEVYLRLAERLEMSESAGISRQKLLALLPLCMERDLQRSPESQVIKMLGKISDAEEDYLYQFTTSRKDDYLRISAVGFAQVVQSFKLIKLVPVLQDLVHDKGLTDRDRAEVVKILATSFPDKDFLTEAFTKYEKATRRNLQAISYLSNEALIRIFKDKKAIQWRLGTLKNTVRPLTSRDLIRQQPVWVYSVYDFRGNLTQLAPLLPALQDEKHIPHFHDLLAFAFKKLEESTDYLDHCLSLFKFTTDFFVGLKEQANGYGVLHDLFQFLDKKEFKEVKHYFGKYRLQLEVEYAKLYDKPRSIQFAINQYNQVKAKNYLPIYNSRDLLLLIKDIIREDIQRFVYKEGFYSMVEYLTPSEEESKQGRSKKRAYPNEDHIQKVLAIQLQNALLKRGLRATDIYREPQLMDNRRIDLLIRYGFVKPIVMELKLLHNQEIVNAKKRKAYKEKLNTYLRSQHAEFGVYMVFKVRPNDGEKYENAFYALREEYADVAGLEIPDFVDCTVKSVDRRF